MYESPIEVFTHKIVQDIEERIEGEIIKECVRVGVNVNKDELIKALRYDRGQYERGRFAGYSEAMANIVHCKECKWFEKDIWGNVTGVPLIIAHGVCERWGNGCKTDLDGFCHMGERREDD